MNKRAMANQMMKVSTQKWIWKDEYNKANGFFER